MLEALALGLALSAGVAQWDDSSPDTLLEPPSAPEEATPSTAETPETWRYQFAQPQRLSVGGGATLVSVESNTPAPSFGTFPIRFFVDNSSGPQQVVRLTYGGNVGGRATTVSREVELGAGERRVVTLPVPAELRYGWVSAKGPGITKGGESSVYFMTHQRVMLSLSTPEAFEAFIATPPDRSTADTMVLTVPPEEAPGELASYVGFDAVVLPDEATLERLGEGPRRALEAYAATGGVLVLKGPLRARDAFPLIGDRLGLTLSYGLGQLVVQPPDRLFIKGRTDPAVSPESISAYRSYGGSGGANARLLPQATAPLGRFLFIIMAFTLAIGPGSVWVARRRGSAALLLSMPVTAAVTCAVIIGYSLIADGFSVHAATFGLTRLDSAQHRAITAGVTAFYANLAPSRVELSTMTVPVGPWADTMERFSANQTWRDGLRLGSDFLPSRSYREWGFLAVAPTRARLGLKQVGDGWVVQNALGHPITRVTVRIKGRSWLARSVQDGEEASLAPQPEAVEEQLVSRVSSRFGRGASAAILSEGLREGEFLAQVTGAGFVPTGGVQVLLHDSEHWVRGEVEP